MSQIDEVLLRSQTLAVDLHELVGALSTTPATNRARIAGGCFYAAFDLHTAILISCHRELFAPAFVLMRPLWEAYIRGTWLAECATEDQLDDFANDKDPPSTFAMVQAIELCEGYETGTLLRAQSSNRKKLHSFTHIGGLLIQRLISSTSFENSFEDGEIEAALDYANGVASLSALGAAKLANDVDAMFKTLSLARSFAN